MTTYSHTSFKSLVIGLPNDSLFLEFHPVSDTCSRCTSRSSPPNHIHCGDHDGDRPPGGSPLVPDAGMAYTGNRTIGPKAWGKPERTSPTPEKTGTRPAISRKTRDMAGKRGRTLTNFLLCKLRQRPAVLESSPSCPPLSSTITSREIVEPAAEEVVYSIVYSLYKISEIVAYTFVRSEAVGS